MSDKRVNIIYDIKDKASKGISSITSRIKNLARTAISLRTLTIGFGLLTTAIGFSVKAWVNQRKVLRQTEAVLKSTGYAAGLTAKEVNNMANAMSKGTNFTDEATQSALNLLLTFTRIGKEAMPDAIKTVLDMSAALGQDLKSSSVQLGKALNDPLKGITALSRVGVAFTDQQKENIKVLVEENNVLGAQSIILKELETEFAGSARAQADGFSKLKNALGDFGEVVGEQLTPALEEVAVKLQEIVARMGDFFKAGKTLGDLISLLGGRVAAFGASLLVIIGVFKYLGLVAAVWGGLMSAPFLAIGIAVTTVAASLVVLNGAFGKAGNNIV